MAKIISTQWVGNIAFLLAILLCLHGCSGTNSAPVFDDATAYLPINDKNHYRVKEDDSLFSIAFAFGQDYRRLAAWNHLSPPYAVRTGQILVVNGGETVQSLPLAQSSALPMRPLYTNTRPRPIVNNPVDLPVATEKMPLQNQRVVKERSLSMSPPLQTSTPQKVAIETDKASGPIKAIEGVNWQWPAQGKVIENYSPQAGKKGINISNKLGASIYASAAGDVVYAGSGLAGYGKLVIIKHNDEYLSAYANNSEIFVKEGQTVKSRQLIAKMGKDADNQAMLHFEIRRAGKPMDPMKYLPAR